ncbi:MAG: MBOAT family protein [Ruminococcaceae bacterium]|jgi:alginate O-acetyltransferase complex protein AlgI|nr:MBOAT family protein [Oscillospiraceae bacterium]
MVFSSLLFLFAFLPVTLALYYAIPNRKARNWVLFVLSLIFYGWGEPVYILVMLASITEAWGFGFLIAKYRVSAPKKARGWMAVSLFCNLAALLFFKYANFFIGNLRLIPLFTETLSPIEGLTLPIGISFYTFQIMSYTIDLYRGQTDVQRNYVAFGAYVTLFPQLIAGPIVRYRDVDDQLTERRETLPLFSSGVRRFLIGLGKKVLIGDACARVYEYAKATAGFHPTAAAAWMTVIFYTLHIYYDFSGYSDMAIGLGRMFGFRFLENFNYPYVSQSITEFWRRWHMSLGTWFKEYVYIPLGGNRVGKFKQFRNIAVVWFLTGFWHGANWNYILWGVYFGVILVAEKTFLLRAMEKTPSVLRRLYALLLIGFGWILFSFTDMAAGWQCFRSLFGIGTEAFCTPTVGYEFLRALPLLILAAVGATPLPKSVWDTLAERDWTAEGAVDAKGNEIPVPDAPLGTRGKVFGILTAVGCFGILLVSTAYLVDSTFSPFLYFIF